MGEHVFDNARTDMWQKSEALKAAKEMGGVIIQPSNPTGFTTKHPRRRGNRVPTAPGVPGTIK